MSRFAQSFWRSKLLNPRIHMEVLGVRKDEYLAMCRFARRLLRLP